jgi:hypothetical protein
LNVAAITYDNEAILKEFAERQQIAYSLISDPESEIIRKFGIVDPDEGPDNLPAFAKKGMPLAGYFFIDRYGVIKEKFFGNIYYDRYTPNNVMAKLFPELIVTTGSAVAAPHLEFRTRQSDKEVVLGNRITLGVEVTLPSGMHVYAPEAKHYKPIQLVIESIDADPLDASLLKATRYPRAQIMFLPAIKERVPVYQHRFSIAQDLVILPPKEVQQKLRAPGNGADAKVTFTVHGTLKYQACDAKICYLPAQVPVTWQLALHRLDMSRSPESIQDKRK